VALSAAAFAQKQELRAFERVPGPVKSAGVYHLATGTWTRGAALQLLAGAGGDVVYSNTSDSNYYARLDPGQVWTASGRLPSLSSPQATWNAAALPVGSQPGSAAGCANAYTIDAFGVAYCTNASGPGGTQMTIAFHETWNPTCTSPVIAPPQGGPFALGLPGRGTAAQLCWSVTIDLSATTQSFSMLADGDGAYLGNTDDAFAWTFTFPSVTAVTVPGTGPLIAGCPADGTGPLHPGIGWKQSPPSTTVEAGGYDGTRFDTFDANTPQYPANGAVGLPNPGVHPSFGGTAEAGTDMVGDDAFRIEGGAAPAPGCYFFGGPIGSGGAFDGPYANFYLDLYAKVVCSPVDDGFAYCAGDGVDPLVTFACPCSNFGGVGRGCASSFNSNGAHVSATGQVALDNVVLHGDGMNATGSCIFICGDVESQGGVQFGDGVACFNGSGSTLIRLRSEALTSGAAQFPSTPGITLSARSGTFPGSGALRSYGVYYRNAAAAFCPPATFNVSNGFRLIW
jgi:hypothetical protein